MMPSVSDARITAVVSVAVTSGMGSDTVSAPVGMTNSTTREVETLGTVVGGVVCA